MVSYTSLCVYWKWPPPLQRYQFITVLAAGFLMHLTFGTIYTYGNMVPYMVSYARNQSAPAGLRNADTVYVYALQVAGVGSSMTLGGILEQRLGPRIVSLCGGWTMSLGVALTYFTIQYSFWLTLVTYGFMFGFGTGLGYMAPLACAIKWLPKHKGVANGIVLSGIGCSALLFNFVQTAYINPSNYSPTCNSASCSDGNYFTQQDLINRVPFVFPILGLIYSVLQFIACIFLVNPSPTEGYHPVPDNENETSAKDKCQSTAICDSESKENTLSDSDAVNLSPREMLTKLNFYLLFIILLSGSLPIAFVVTLYKAFGQSLIDGDYLLTTAGSVSAMFNLLGRILWGALADKTSYKLALLLQSTTMCFLLYTFYGVSILSPALYFIWLCGIFFCVGGLYSLLPTAVAKAFGPDYMGVNYGIMYVAVVLASVMASFIAELFERVVGWDWVFVIPAGVATIAYVTALCYRHRVYEVRKPIG